MEDELFIMFYIAVPIVLLAAAFVYYMHRRREDIEKASRSNTMPREEGEIRPGENQRRRETPLQDVAGAETTGSETTGRGRSSQSQPT